MNLVRTALCLLLPLSTGCRGASCDSDPSPVAPELFAPGAVSTVGREFATSFAPDGRTVYFNTVEDGRIPIRYAVREGEGWSGHRALPWSDGVHRDVDPFVTPDGTRLVFCSDRPRPGDEPAEGEEVDFDLWQAHRTANGWGPPEPLPAPPNSAESEVFATFTTGGDGLLQHPSAGRAAASVPQPARRRDLRAARATGARPPGGGLGGQPADRPGRELPRVHLRRPGRPGAMDLVLVTRTDDGGWSTPRVLPEPINSPYADFAPGLGPDGTTLYFTSERPGMVAEDAVDGRPPRGPVPRVVAAIPPQAALETKTAAPPKRSRRRVPDGRGQFDRGFKRSMTWSIVKLAGV